MARRPCWERPLPSVQSLGREQAARRHGGMGGAFARPARPAPLLVPRRQGQKQLLWQDRGSQGLGSTSVLPHGASSCPRALPHAAGLCRRPPLPTGWGAAGPHAASPLFLQLPGAEGAVAGHTAGVRRGDAPGAGGRGNTAPQLGTRAPAPAGSSRAELPDKREEAAWAHPPLSLSLPAPQDTRRRQESPREPSPIHQTPQEGAEPPSSRECLSALGSVREHCSCSRAAEASLLTFLHSFSLAQWRTLSARSLERLMEGQAEVRMAASALPLAVPGCQGCAASGVSLCGREGHVVAVGERRGLGSQQERRHVLAGGAGRKPAARGTEPGRPEGPSSAALRLLVPPGSSPVALAAAGLLSKRSPLLAGCSQARASDGPI